MVQRGVDPAEVSRWTLQPMSTNDPDFFETPKFSSEAFQPPKQRGCFFYGCVIASVLAALMVVLLAVVSFFLYRFTTKMVDEYTGTAPRELPVVKLTPEERATVKTRLLEFRAAVTAGTPTEPLVLSGDDLNALIEDDPDLKGKAFIKIEDDVIKGQISIPLESVGLKMFKGRYLNGEADIKALLISGVLIVTLDSIEVNGKRPPEEILQGIRQQNLAKDIYKDPKNAEMIRKLESIQIKDGKITIKVRAKTNPDDAKTKESAPPAKANSAAPAAEPAKAKSEAPPPPAKNGAPVEIKAESPPTATAPRP